MATYNTYTNRKGTFWQVRGYLGKDEATGKSVEYRKRGFKTKKQAQASFAHALNDFMLGNLPNHKTPYTYKQLYHEWIEQNKLNIKESSLNQIQSIFNLHILPVFGQYRIDKITHKQLQGFVNDLHQSHKSYKTIYNYACSVLDYAVKVGYIEVSPKNRVQVPKKVHQSLLEDEQKKLFYTKEELQHFFKLLEKENKPLWFTYFRLLAFTGVRRSEALALTWNDISFKNSTLSINKTLSIGLNNQVILNQSPKTKASNRVISLDKKTVDFLKAWKKEQAELLIQFGYNALQGEQLVFSRLKDNQYFNINAPNRFLSKFCKTYNFPSISVHGFRHTHCSLLFEAGASLKDVKERLGHSNIQTTMNIYTHVTQSSREQTAQQFANYMNF